MFVVSRAAFSRAVVYGLPAGLLVLFGLSWTLPSLPWEPDESRYLECAREMAASDDWLFPTLNGVPYLEKPPLYVMSIAALFKLFGPSDLAARAVSVAAGAGTVLLTSWIASLAAGPRAALRAGLILATSPFFLVLSTVVTLDMLFTLWVTAAIACFAQGTTDPDPGRPWRRTILHCGYLSLGLAILTKGPVALVVPGLVWIFWRPMGRERILPPCLLGGLTILLAVSVPWFVLVQAKYPKFWDFFFLKGHLGRVIGDDVANVNFHGEPWYFYLPVLLGGTAPWMLFIGAPWRVLRPEITRSLWARLGWSWLLPGFAFFSMVSGKLPTYVLPLFPAVSILATLAWEDVEASRRSMAVGAALAATLVAAGVGGLAMARALDVEVWWADYVEWPVAWAALAVCVAGLGTAAVLLWRKRDLLSFAAVVLGLSALLLAGGFQKASIDRAVSTDGLARAVRRVAGPTDTMVCVNKYLPLFAFHLGRAVIVCGQRGELDFGSEELKLRPDLFWDFAALKARLDGPSRIFLSISRRRLPKFEAMVGRKLHLLGSTRNAYLLSNQAEPWPYPSVEQDRRSSTKP